MAHSTRSPNACQRSNEWSPVNDETNLGERNARTTSGISPVVALAVDKVERRDFHVITSPQSTLAVLLRLFLYFCNVRLDGSNLGSVGKVDDRDGGTVSDLEARLVLFHEQGGSNGNHSRVEGPGIGKLSDSSGDLQHRYQDERYADHTP